MIKVTQSFLPPIDEYIEELKSVWENKWLTNMGEKHNKLESELTNYLNVPYVSLFNNGHTALEMAIELLEIKGEVITTPFTFASTTHAITRKGLKPVFCDINSETFTIDSKKIENLITSNTSAIMPVHVYGNVCDVEKIEEIARKYNLKVIYDAAHAFGCSYKGKGIGTFGDISMFSFHATKVFHTIEGGALTFKNPQYSKLLYQLKNFGITSPEEVVIPGGNGKMNEFSAAMGVCNLKYINDNIDSRKKIFDRYIERLSNIKGITLNNEQENVIHNYAYFPVLFNKEKFGKSRDEVQYLLAKENIFTRKYFYPLTNDFECYKEEYDSSLTPVAKKAANEILTLPIFPQLSVEDVDKICNIILFD